MLLKSRICNYSGNMLKYKQLRHEKCMKTQKNKTYGVDYVMLMKAKLKVILIFSFSPFIYHEARL